MGLGRSRGDEDIEDIKNDLVRRLNSARDLDEIVEVVAEADDWLYRRPNDQDVRAARASAATRPTRQ